MQQSCNCKPPHHQNQDSKQNPKLKILQPKFSSGEHSRRLHFVIWSVEQFGEYLRSTSQQKIEFYTRHFQLNVNNASYQTTTYKNNPPKMRKCVLHCIFGTAQRAAGCIWAGLIVQLCFQPWESHIKELSLAVFCIKPSSTRGLRSVFLEASSRHNRVTSNGTSVRKHYADASQIHPV